MHRRGAEDAEDSLSSVPSVPSVEQNPVFIACGAPEIMKSGLK